MKNKIQTKAKILGLALAAAAVTAIATPAAAWWQPDYAYRTKINLSAAAAGISGEVARAPVLVRLHTGNFSFDDVKADGSDLRFVAGDDRTPLKFHIETWNPAEQQALVWVDVSGLKPGAPTAIYAYYGAKDQKDLKGGQDVAGTFGPDYKLVWHFDAAGPKDATANGLNGAGGETRSAGLIGQGLKLDGTAGVAIPAGALTGGPATISFWVKPAADGQILALPGLSLASEGGSLVLRAGQTKSVGAALPAGTWAHVALVNDGQKSTLYLNGQSAGEVEGALAAGPATLGNGFSGEIDELRVAGVALPQADFQLAAASEGQGARLLTFDTAEQTDGGGHNYFGILFKALTPDAWAVIGVLAVMLALAVWVMISKGLMLARTGAANDDFLDAYARAATARAEHDGLPELPAGADGSTLATLYRIGQRELKKRLAEGRASGSRFALRAQSIASIRSALDAGQVREAQKLNRSMVLLTIAISGGPFIGLLGTVLGVMITFASVAAAGEVNINAIAPGIAAALLATVAGLAVAIPSLFGYNYLLSRVEEIGADNQIFVDELEKRIAETWQDLPAPGPTTAFAAQ